MKAGYLSLYKKFPPERREFFIFGYLLFFTSPRVVINAAQRITTAMQSAIISVFFVFSSSGSSAPALVDDEVETVEVSPEVVVCCG